MSDLVITYNGDLCTYRYQLFDIDCYEPQYVITESLPDDVKKYHNITVYVYSEVPIEMNFSDYVSCVKFTVYGGDHDLSSWIIYPPKITSLKIRGNTIKGSTGDKVSSFCVSGNCTHERQPINSTRWIVFSRENISENIMKNICCEFRFVKLNDKHIIAEDSPEFERCLRPEWVQYILYTNSDRLILRNIPNIPENLIPEIYKEHFVKYGLKNLTLSPRIEQITLYQQTGIYHYGDNITLDLPQEITKIVIDTQVLTVTEVNEYDFSSLKSLTKVHFDNTKYIVPSEKYKINLLMPPDTNITTSATYFEITNNNYTTYPINLNGDFTVFHYISLHLRLK